MANNFGPKGPCYIGLAYPKNNTIAVNSKSPISMKCPFNRLFWVVLTAAMASSMPSMAVVDALQDKIHAYFETGRSTDAVALLQQESARGNAEAQYGLGVLYEKGLPEAKIPEDASQAFHWYSLSAGNGYAPSQNNL